MSLRDAIGSGQVYCIAEMSGNHGGSLQHALEIVHAAAESGADCLKTQTYTADTLTLNCNSKDFQIASGLWAGQSLYELYLEAYTPWEWQSEIMRECEKVGIDYMSSVFDKSSVDFLEQHGIECYKIASPEIVDIPLIKYAASKGKTMVMSVGMASEEEIYDAVNACKELGNDDIVLLKCTAEYPALYEDMNLISIPMMASKFKVDVGLSDHSMGHYVDVAAVALGARVIEKHFCLSRSEDTVDSAFSMEPSEFKEMVAGVKTAVKAMGRATFDRSGDEEINSAWRRSIYATKDIDIGEVFTEENCRSVRPGYGLAPKYYEDLLGRVASRRISFGEPILPIDLS